MNNQEIFIIVLIIVLVLLGFSKWSEGFESVSNHFPCDIHPFNSNCTCQVGTKQIIDGPYPVEFGQKSPYKFDCVSNSAKEPETTVWPNPPEY
jgi:hypothetical protein